MPYNNNLDDNVEYVDFPTGDVKYHGADPHGPEQSEHGYARQNGDGQVPDSEEKHGSQLAPEPDEMTRDEMLEALDAAGVQHGLRRNSSRAKVLEVYEAHQAELEAGGSD